jgi:hypothetical protein
MTVFTWKGENYYDSNGLHSLLQTLSTIWTYGYGASNGNIKAWVGGINYKFFNMTT